MDSFKEMVEDKMRDAITRQVEGELTEAEDDLRTREAEFRDLQETDTRAEKRQMWMQSISGQNATAPSAPANPAALGARPDAIAAAAGRPMRGALGTQQQVPQPRMGLAGMRSPITSSKPLSPLSGVPLAKPIKAPLGIGDEPALPQPVQKLIRKPLQPVGEEELQEIPEPEVQIEQVLEPMTEPAEEFNEQAESEMSTTLRPITTVLQSVGSSEVIATTTLTAKPPQLIPVKGRGTPPSSKAGESPSLSKTTTLKPVTKLTPLKIKPPVLKAKKEDGDEETE
jgi:hypothetical protein